MNKNTILAFLLILLCIQLFTSRFYFEKILRKPYPFDKSKVIERENTGEGRREERSEIKRRNLQEENSKVERNFEKIFSIEPNDSTGIDSIKYDTIFIETDKIICGISEYGGRIISIRTKEYKYIKNGEEGDYIELISENSLGGANLRINDINFDNKFFNYSGADKKINFINDEEMKLRFIYTTNDSSSYIKEFSFFKGKYKIGYKIISDRIIENNVEVGWNCGVAESEKSSGRMAKYNNTKVHLYDGKTVEHIVHKKKKKEERTGYYKWAGITSKYFLIALVPEKTQDADIKIESYIPVIKDKDKEEGNGNLNYKIKISRFASDNEESYWIYAGPSQITNLKKYKNGLQKVLFLGYGWFFFADKWFPPLCEFVLWLLIQLQRLVKDYGIVIIFLTIIMRVVTYPLTHSSMKSMNKMKEIQPRINKIKEKYKSNPKKMNQKTMEFYKKEGINPLAGVGGCLPMILQMPIMISLFVVLRKAIELRGQGTFLVPWIKDLTQAEALIPLGFNVPMYGNNIALLPILMAVLMFFQNKATMKDPNQKAMVYIMPVMMLVLFNNFPSGLSLYFTFSTALQLVQQKFMDLKKKSTKSS